MSPDAFGGPTHQAVGVTGSQPENRALHGIEEVWGKASVWGPGPQGPPGCHLNHRDSITKYNKGKYYGNKTLPKIFLKL